MSYVLLSLGVCATLVLGLGYRYRKTISTACTLATGLLRAKLQSKLENTCEVKSRYISLSYVNAGRVQRCAIPYRLDKLVDMVCYVVYLYRSDGSAIDITQEPGIPYLLTAAELGGVKITAFNTETGVTHDYHESPPMWCTELEDFITETEGYES